MGYSSSTSRREFFGIFRKYTQPGEEAGASAVAGAPSSEYVSGVDRRDALKILGAGGAGFAGLMAVGCGTREGPDIITPRRVGVLKYTGEIPGVGEIPILNLSRLLDDELRGARGFRRYEDMVDGHGDSLSFFMETGERGIEFRFPFHNVVKGMNPNAQFDKFEGRMLVLKGTNGLYIPDLNGDGIVGNPKIGLLSVKGGNLNLVGMRNARGQLLEKYAVHTDEAGQARMVFRVVQDYPGRPPSDPKGRRAIEIMR